MILKSLEPRLPDLDIALLVYYPSLACRSFETIEKKNKTKQKNDRKERKEKQKHQVEPFSYHHFECIFNW